MTPLEFTDYVHSAQEPRVAEYILGKIDDETYNLLEKLVYNLDTRKFTPGTLRALKRILRSLPCEVAFYYYRRFYFHQQVRPMIDDSKVMMHKISVLRGMNKHMKGNKLTNSIAWAYVRQIKADILRKFSK